MNVSASLGRTTGQAERPEGLKLDASSSAKKDFLFMNSAWMGGSQVLPPEALTTKKSEWHSFIYLRWLYLRGTRMFPRRYWPKSFSCRGAIIISSRSIYNCHGYPQIYLIEELGRLDSESPSATQDLLVFPVWCEIRMTYFHLFKLIILTRNKNPRRYWPKSFSCRGALIISSISRIRPAFGRNSRKPCNIFEVESLFEIGT
jgi:hypothetical protein